MSFNSPFFLFLFLPPVVVVYLLAGKKARNALLLAASLFFYGWSDPLYFPVILVCLLVNYGVGRRIFQGFAPQPEKGKEEVAERRTSRWLWAGVGFNLLVLVFFKVAATYWQEIVPLGAALGLPVSDASLAYLRKIIAYPLGISFITFQAISYLMDVYQQRVDAEKSLFRFALYLLLFPKLIAGPIARYRDLAAQLGERTVSAQGLADGARRFCIGLAKKALLADRLSLMVDQGALAHIREMTTPQAWLVLVCYTLQIYLDFSGYTDMALGLGQIFGFRFVENFNYPYISKSIADFWRRWHISLSSWFRDYVFYPLEWRRRGGAKILQAVNILVVFGLTGLWHGLTPNFLVWGLLHGAAIALESGPFGRWLKKAWLPLQHLYALLVVMLGWVFFRTATLGQALDFLGVLSGGSAGHGGLPFSVFQPLETLGWAALAAGAVVSMPVGAWLRQARPGWFTWKGASILRDALLLVLLAAALVSLAASSYQPYIYGRF